MNTPNEEYLVINDEKTINFPISLDQIVDQRFLRRKTIKTPAPSCKNCSRRSFGWGSKAFLQDIIKLSELKDGNPEIYLTVVTLALLSPKGESIEHYFSWCGCH